MKIVVAAALLAPLVLVSGAAAQPADVLRLSLDDAIARGLASSHRVDEAAARRDAAEAAVQGQVAATRPLAAISAGYMRTNHVDEFGVLLPGGDLRVIYPDIPDNARTRLDLSWPLYTGGRTAAAIDAARGEAAASGSDIEALRSTLRSEITQAFWQLYVARASQAVVTESVRRMTNQLNVTREQLAAGLIPPNDVESVRAELVHQQMLATQSDANIEVAEAALARLINVPPGTRIEPAGGAGGGTQLQSADALIAEALATRSDVHALQLRIAAAADRRRLAEAGGRPTVAVNGGVDYANPNPRIFPRQDAWKSSWDVGVNATWQLFDGGRREAEVAQSAAAERALRARAEELTSTIGLEVRQRMAELRAARAAFAASADGVSAATEALRVVSDRFRVGVATVADTLDAEVALARAELERQQALAAVGLAAGRLERALGK
jgi:outer membrane protein TolC